jgi:putative transcriptional regulator
MSNFGKELLDSAQDAVAISKGKVLPAKRLDLDLVDVALVRKRMKLSQVGFAKKFGLSAATVRDWEQGRRVPDSTARILLKVIAQRPEAVIAALKA